MPDDYDIAQPEPSALVESLRAFGYSLPAAVADLVDNSISARAKNVWIRFEWSGKDSHVIVKDDGLGMTEEELINAMRPGSKSPLEIRPKDDLGRFGLGLKTASFSQCRRLSVSSTTGKDPLVSRCWDLDYIEHSKEWRLLKDFSPDPLQISNETLQGGGTIVLWQKMDRVTGSSSEEDTAAYQRFLEAIDRVKVHLAMVFHRFLEKPSGLKLWINGRQVETWDPFLRHEKATQELPPENLMCEETSFKVTPYVLPHQSKISSEVHKRAAGPKGWNAQQGYYVYRNERLLVPGDWLGLGIQKEEHYKLARIQIDLPNSMDSAWQIDVKKSQARPPGYLRGDLKRIARLTREQAAQIYRHRGTVTARRVSQDHVFLWLQKTRHGKYFYAINRGHPLIRQALTSSGKTNIEPVLRALEETVPAAHIMITTAEEPDKMAAPFEGCTYESIKPLMERVYISYLESGCTKEDAFSRLLTTEPFSHYPEFVEAYREQQEAK